MDVLNFILWWGIIWIVGVLFFPFTKRIFNKFYDGGYLFSKTLGIAFVSYIVWLFASIKLIPFYRFVIILFLIITPVILTYLMLKHSKAETNDNLNEKKYSSKLLIAVVLEEILFIGSLGFWTYLRGCMPKLEGLEKFMDWGFVESILRSEFMPPKDMWLSGEHINYYYYGHYVTAFLTKLSGIKPEITYNLMMATLFAFALCLVFSLTTNISYIFLKGNLKKTIIPGLVAGLLVSLGGNLHTVLFAGILPLLKRLGMDFKDITVSDRYWFPDATRYIGYNPPVDDKTIHEFPAYSFVVSDLHAHVINTIFVITILAVIFTFIYKNIKIQARDYKWYNFSPEFIIISFFIGIFQMTNYWDFPIYFTVSAFSIFYINYIRYKNLKKTMIYTGINLAVILFISSMVALPFKLNFFNFSNGIYFTPTHSKLYQLLVLWGYQLFFVVYFSIFMVYKQVKAINLNNKKANIKNRKAKQSLSNTLISKLRILEISDIFTLILSISAIGLIIIPEIVYVKDIYSIPYHRSNTMFKLTYQSFIMFTIVVGYVITRIFSKKDYSIKTSLLQLGVIILIIIPLIYPIWSINDWYGKDKFKFIGLDGGLNVFAKEYSDELNFDVDASRWLENLKGQPVILEAAGDSYTRYGRMSVSTGLPTVLGWYAHEWLWHNRTDILNIRKRDIETIYESQDLAKTVDCVNKYNIKYIVIGELEKKKYTKLNQDKLLKLGKLEFENQGTKIIKINPNY